MSPITYALIAIVCALHIGFLILEMFLWQSQGVRKRFGMSADYAKESSKLAANQGLYNGFLAAGLIWGLYCQRTDVIYFFLGCVIVAGLYGGLTTKRSILVVQLLPALIALGALYYQAPAKPAMSVSQAVARPADPDNLFAGCSWGEVKGAKFSIWSHACGAEKNNERLVPDDKNDAMLLVGGKGFEAYSRTIVKLFHKDKNAPIEAILGDIRAQSPGPSTATCVLTRRVSSEGPSKYYMLTPTGEAKLAWDKTQIDGIGEPPCGEMGVQMSADRVFFVLKSDPSAVIYVDEGSEIQIFNQRSVTTLK